jgi:maltooligosyltrehalose trehalohydrolase
MLRYYKKLIGLRKTIPALHSTNRQDTQGKVDSNNKTLILERTFEKESIICALNFSDQQQTVDIGTAGMRVILDSSSTEWAGPSATQLLPVKNKITLQPESIVLLA